MVTSRKLTAKDLYRQFQDSLLSFRPGSWTLAVFEGSPTDGLYLVVPRLCCRLYASSYV